MKITDDTFAFLLEAVAAKLLTDNVPCLKWKSLVKYAKTGFNAVSVFFFLLGLFVIAKLAAAGIIKPKPQTVMVLIAAMLTFVLYKYLKHIQKTKAAQF